MGSGTRFSPNIVSPPICYRLLFLFLTIISGTAICRAENKSDWVEVRSPNFVVVTNGGERQGRTLAYQSEPGAPSSLRCLQATALSPLASPLSVC
jgi:hypothetical protein